MDQPPLLHWTFALAPAVLMSVAMLVARRQAAPIARLWKGFAVLSFVASLCALVALGWSLMTSAASPADAARPSWFGLSLGMLSAWLAVLVQGLGTVIGVFSSRYLQGESGQPRYVAALAAVLATVHLLLLANHWVVLIAAWALVGQALQQLLCFYPDRPFALLAAHKKFIADRLADALLVVAAALAWWQVGSGSLSALSQHLAQGHSGAWLQVSAVCLVLAVILRTALLPMHGWLIQVMEAPTPVSALLHAGVVNLGGFVLIRFAFLLEAAPAARWLLVAFGLTSACLAGLVMLTRISIKVRLAWSTVAQMGFMVLECGLGLYTLAALHLIGHSLYKAHTFLSASTVVHSSKLQMMRGRTVPSALSLLLAPAFSLLCIVLVQWALGYAAWPWWWTGVLALAWASLLWLPTRATAAGETLGWRASAGLLMVASLTALAWLAHGLPFGVGDAPDPATGVVALAGMAAMYFCLVLLQLRPHSLAAWRRWSYAGFYVDELCTRFTLRLWPTRWTATAHTLNVQAARTQAAVATVK